MVPPYRDIVTKRTFFMVAVAAILAGFVCGYYESWIVTALFPATLGMVTGIFAANMDYDDYERRISREHRVKWGADQD